MTDHRTLKRLVRERMARTGERYTTAHRHVVAQVATHVPGADRPGVPTAPPGSLRATRSPDGRSTAPPRRPGPCSRTPASP